MSWITPGRRSEWATTLIVATATATATASGLGAGPAPPSWADAIRRTQAEGLATVLVVTSARAPGSAEVCRGLVASPAAARLADRVVLAELSAEAEPAQVGRLKVAAPALVAFRRGAGGNLERVATRPGYATPDEFAAWVRERGIAPGLAADPAITPAGFGGDPAASPSPQHQPPTIPYFEAPMPPPVVLAAPAPAREVVVELPVERRVVRRAAPREVDVEREVVVERVAAPARRVVREVEVEEAPTRTVNVLTRPRDAAPRAVVREVAPREAEEEFEEVEVVSRRAAPRAVVREVEARPLVVREEAEAVRPEALALIQPGPIDRFVGLIGARLRRRSLPRVDLQVETQQTYRLAAPTTTRVVAAPAVARPIVVAPTACPAPAYPAPMPSLPSYPVPTPQRP